MLKLGTLNGLAETWRPVHRQHDADQSRDRKCPQCDLRWFDPPWPVAGYVSSALVVRNVVPAPTASAVAAPALEHHGMPWRSWYGPLQVRPALGTRHFWRPQYWPWCGGKRVSARLDTWSLQASACSQSTLPVFSVSTGRKLAEEHAATLAQLATRVTAIIFAGSGAGEDPRA